ncbi:MAG: hypothetical protein PF450_13375 [Bacteroidales bacterium]|nr:hypothetical protein [Bacteroidales bacterium]
MKPQDVIVLLKIVNLKDKPWTQLTLADELFISQSEISTSIARSKYADLLHANGKSVMALAFMDFLQFGIRYVFPVKPGPMVRGVPTAHSASPLKERITSVDDYVWPSAKGQARGHSIIPLYPSVVDAVKLDTKLYEMLALVDALRVGKAREKEFAIDELKQMILDE